MRACANVRTSLCLSYEPPAKSKKTFVRCARDHIILYMPSAAEPTSLKYRSATLSNPAKYNNYIIIIIIYLAKAARWPNSFARNFNII